MADSTVADLSELTAVEDGDFVYVVDVSDTTDSADGSSKKAQAKNVRGIPQTPAESTAGVTPTNYEYEPGNVLRYGATGDGVTDDSTAIQSAVDSGEKNIYFPPGTYLVNTKISFGGVNVSGDGATLTTTGNGTIFEVDASNTWVRDLTFTGPGDSAFVSGSRGISITGSTNSPSAPTYIENVRIENCDVSGFKQYGIFFAYTKYARAYRNRVNNIAYGGICGISCTNVDISHNEIRDFDIGSSGDAYGTFVDRSESDDETAHPRSDHVVISNNIITGITASGGNGQGINTHAGTDFVISDNIVTGCQKGIFITASNIASVAQLAPQRVAVTGNAIQQSGGTGVGIIINGASASGTVNEYAEGCAVCGNIIDGAGTANTGTSGALIIQNTKGVTVHDNLIKDSASNAIYVNIDNDFFSIMGNTIVDPYDDTFSAPSCVWVNDDNNTGTISNNVFVFDDSGIGTNVAVNAVRIQSSLTGLDISIKENYLQGEDATHLQYTLLTTTGVTLSYETDASGTGSIASGTTSDVIAHGLDITPTLDQILITLGENPTNTPGAIWVDTIGATNFTVNCENDPGASNLDFSWRVIT